MNKTSYTGKPTEKNTSKYSPEILAL